MSRRTLELTDTLYDYVLEVSLRESEVGRRLREETSRLERAQMQISPEQGQFMAWLVELIGARRILEVGTFTGYSALMMAQALPPEGRLVACDISAEWTAIGRRYWQEAAVQDRIELHLGPALDSLDRFLAQGQEGSYDLAFLDADKINMEAYYERSLQLVRPGGIILLDNTLWGGSVAAPTQDPDTLALQALNRKLHADTRISLSLLPISDGLTLCRKRS